MTEIHVAVAAAPAIATHRHLLLVIKALYGTTPSGAERIVDARLGTGTRTGVIEAAPSSPWTISPQPLRRPA